MRIYGPEGPADAMRECAEMFSRIRGVKTEVITGPGEKWIKQAREDADVVYEETEHGLIRFMTHYPCLVDESSRTSLYVQPAGILVRNGNPKRITTFEDLTRPGIYLIDLNGEASLGLWEDLAGRKGLIPDIRKKIAVIAENGSHVVERWKTTPALDAWIALQSWHYRFPEITDLVKLAREEGTHRGTAAVATQFYKNREAAREFLHFLKTPECHAVFRKWGWE